MKAILAILTGFSLVSSAQAAVDANVYVGTEAACNGRLGAIVRNPKAPMTVTQDVYTIAKNALRHYRDTLTRGGVYIESATVYRDLTRNAIAGYRVTITDGGDESLVTYYFDGKGKLVYGKWDNQSPETFWFCEK